MTADVTRIGAYPVSDDDARHVLTQVLNASSERSFDVAHRSFVFTMQSGVGEHRAEVTVHHADAPDDDQGVTYAVTFQRLAWCDDHRRTYFPADRLCTECVLDQMEGDS